MERGGKRLVICCDGTWNEPDQEVHDNPADKTEPTNVLKIVRGLAPVDGEQVPQVVYYDTGVGTQGMADKYVGGGYRDCGLSNIALAWLAGRAASHGLDFTDSAIPTTRPTNQRTSSAPSRTASRSGRRLGFRGLTDPREKLQAWRREFTRPGVGGYCMKHAASFLLILLCSSQAFAECVEGDCTNGQGHMKYDDGSEYIGQWKDGKRHGYGRWKLANGAEFVGDWQDDERKGRAVYIFVNRARYAIEWTGDEPQTNGPWAWSDGGKYVGLHDDREHGHGTVMYNDGGTYVGGYNHGDKQGIGTFVYPSGGIYFGDWFEGKPSGLGRFILPDGGVFCGEWKDGMPNGQGRLTNPDTSIKEGLWSNGQFVDGGPAPE